MDIPNQFFLLKLIATVAVIVKNQGQAGILCNNACKFLLNVGITNLDSHKPDTELCNLWQDAKLLIVLTNPNGEPLQVASRKLIIQKVGTQVPSTLAWGERPIPNVQVVGDLNVFRKIVGETHCVNVLIDYRGHPVLEGYPTSTNLIDAVTNAIHGNSRDVHCFERVQNTIDLLHRTHASVASDFVGIDANEYTRTIRNLIVGNGIPVVRLGCLIIATIEGENLGLRQVGIHSSTANRRTVGLILENVAVLKIDIPSTCKDALEQSVRGVRRFKLHQNDLQTVVAVAPVSIVSTTNPPHCLFLLHLAGTVDDKQRVVVRYNLRNTVARQAGA